MSAAHSRLLIMGCGVSSFVWQSTRCPLLGLSPKLPSARLVSGIHSTELTWRGILQRTFTHFHGRKVQRTQGTVGHIALANPPFVSLLEEVPSTLSSPVLEGMLLLAVLMGVRVFSGGDTFHFGRLFEVTKSAPCCNTRFASRLFPLPLPSPPPHGRHTHTRLGIFVFLPSAELRKPPRGKRPVSREQVWLLSA